MSSELQSYYDNFRTGYWASLEESECPCHGGGWALSDVDTWHQCPIHYTGQAHPESEEWDDSPEAQAERLAQSRQAVRREVECSSDIRSLSNETRDEDACPF
jgi:hypothetical protein